MITQSKLSEWPCGCYYETSLDISGEVCLIRAKTCGACFDQFHEMLEQLTLDKRSQLTLDLASQRELAPDDHS